MYLNDFSTDWPEAASPPQHWLIRVCLIFEVWWKALLFTVISGFVKSEQVEIRSQAYANMLDRRWEGEGFFLP